MSSRSAEDKAKGYDWENVPDEPGAAPHMPPEDDTTATVTEVFPPADQVAETAKALNDAAEELGLLHRVQWSGDHFNVPPAVADKAKLPSGATDVQVPNPTMTLGTATVPPQSAPGADAPVIPAGTNAATLRDAEAAKKAAPAKKTAAAHAKE